jgi:hypothetical protein
MSLCEIIGLALLSLKACFWIYFENCRCISPLAYAQTFPKSPVQKLIPQTQKKWHMLGPEYHKSTRWLTKPSEQQYPMEVRSLLRMCLLA